MSVKKGWAYQWSLIPDELFTEHAEDIEEYVQEWDFPYPGQKEFLAIDRNILVSVSSPLAGKGKPHIGRLRYPGQGDLLAQVRNPMFLVSLKK
ncbi:hypothetical protein [Endozoicomonas sp.]|uniref:hypothetical protein n=1 Tax=Endozoicomonas sp. TaxID=1892382 RepID=UPI00383B16F9